jgi:hypothetical protein
MYKETLSAVLALAIWLMAVVAVAATRAPDNGSLFRNGPSYPVVLPADSEPCNIGTC